MSVATEIERLQGLKADLRTKLVSLLGISSTATLAECVEAVEGIADNGDVSKTLDTTTTSYTVPAGYHDGGGKVTIALETKSVTPTKSAQTVTPGTGKVLSKVSVAAIPDAYQDVSGVDAAAAHVLSGYKIVTASGTLTAGTMANNGTVAATINGTTVTSYTIPEGYHSGKGTVSLDDTIETALAAL